ncbi:MAG: alpha-amylase family glycosyl hydrolase [Anaerolineales bacterium]
MSNILLRHLTFLYGEEQSSLLLDRVQTILADHRPRLSRRASGLSQRDSLLILYGDQVQNVDEMPLQTLKKFCDTYLKDVVSGIHILPFYSWTSDDGFSVVDYRQIDSSLGDWDDVSALRNFRLMFDAVINHLFQKQWFQKFLQDDPRYKDAIVVKGEPDLSKVVRPRALPLLTPFQTPSGEKKCGPPSRGQIDLSFKNRSPARNPPTSSCSTSNAARTHPLSTRLPTCGKRSARLAFTFRETHAVVNFYAPR